MNLGLVRPTGGQAVIWSRPYRVLGGRPNSAGARYQFAPAWCGPPLIDAAHVDELATVCAGLSRYSFLLTVAPPRILGMTGVPVNPLAIF
jgi:hypothetical protein